MHTHITENTGVEFADAFLTQYKIVESFKLEKSLRIIKYNC